MENLIFLGMALVIFYQIYSTHKNVNKLVGQIEDLKHKIDKLQK
ncbi:hypothetical protein [Salinimicrobium xinjiangense]|nr:hypothetical protein [Salinimicrobium xinjiangense]